MSVSREASVNSVRFAAIDFESAGVRPGQSDVPIQVGWGFLEKGKIDSTQFFRRYLYTDQPVTWAASKVHGIQKAHLEQADRFESFWPEVREQLKPCVMIAHGHATEKRFLRQFPTHGLGPWVDTLQLARKWCHGLRSHQLADVVSGLGLEEELRDLCPHYDWHDALFDAVACLVILRKLIKAGELEHSPVSCLL